MKNSLDISQTNLTPYDDDTIAFWKQLYDIEKIVKVSFDVSNGVYDRDVINVRELYRSIVEKKPFRKDETITCLSAFDESKSIDEMKEYIGKELFFRFLKEEKKVVMGVQLEVVGVKYIYTAEQEDVLKAQLDNSVDEIDKEIETKQLQGEEREALIKVRVNQSAFRKLLMRRYTHCCLCDVDDESLLVASHIKPWAKSSHAEKVDVNNGLLLCPNHDKLFDRGYISFDNGGHIVISDELSKNCAISMNIKNDMQIELSNDNIKYMEYHRNNVLK